MKTLFVAISICLSLISFGQDDTKQDYLVEYGQVWGFLKYFHPAPSQQDWDQVLLKDFTAVQNCASDSAFNAIVSKMIDNCGSYKPQIRVVVDSLKFDESFEWMNNNHLSKGNQKYLFQLLNNKPSFKNKYITGTTVGKPRITNELGYGDYAINPAINFLALTRYGNIINYYCPNRNLIPKNWTTVYEEHLSGFTSINTYEDYYLAIKKLTAEIRDGHGFVRTEKHPDLKYKYMPFRCEKVVEGYFISMVLQDSVQPFNLKKMDKLISINGISVEDKVAEIGLTKSTSNDYALSKHAAYFLGLSDRDTVVVTVSRNGQLITETILAINGKTFNHRCTPIQMETSISYQFLTDSISGENYCYIDMGKLKRKEINGKFKRELLASKHIIIDSRNYPNWTVMKLSKILIKGKRKFSKFIQMDMDYPGTFYWKDGQTIGGSSKGYDGEIFVLVDYNTQSQAEYTVMAFQQHPNTKVVGGQTAGADGDITEIPLPFGIRSVFSGLSVFYPDDTPTQQIGVRRDMSIEQNKVDMENEKDTILEKALELIRE